MELRNAFVSKKLQEAFEISSAIAEQSVQRHHAKLAEFYDGSGLPILTWIQKDGGLSKSAAPYVVDLELEPTAGSVAWFARSGITVTERNCENEINIGVIVGSVVDAFQALFAELYIPLLSAQESWGQAPKNVVQNFLQGANTFGSLLSEAAQASAAEAPLKLPASKTLAGVELRIGSFNKAANDSDIANACNDCVSSWCDLAENLLENSTAVRKDDGVSGPNSELEWWGMQLAKLSQIKSQLKSFEAKATVGIVNATRSKTAKRWHELEFKVADMEAEAKDNCKYMKSLQASYESQYTGTPHDIINNLPTILKACHNMHSVARYYADHEKLASLLGKATNQIIANGTAHIVSPGKIWEQPLPALLENLNLIKQVHTVYQQSFRAVFAQELRKHDGIEQVVFKRMQLFSKRCAKLSEFFAAVDQFSNLAQHTHIEGLVALLKQFENAVEDVRIKPYNLLDFDKTQFDRDFLEFNVRVNDLELALQGFVNQSFERQMSTDSALNLLLQFQAILTRESLQADLEAKYQIIFHNYLKDLEAVQQIYEQQKGNPPRPRDAPLVAGCIMWARHLLRRIEQPMNRFVRVKSVVQCKEFKLGATQYNRVARTLTEFQILWHQSWLHSLENTKSTLQANLITVHPDTGKLLVNFDKSLQEVVWEARWLSHLGFEVPQTAQAILLQETKLSSYYQQLSHALTENEQIAALVRPALKPMLVGHFAGISDKLAPGANVLTWVSMNIDGYLHALHKSLAKFEDLVLRINDQLDSVISVCLQGISSSLFFDLPAKQSLNIEDFVALQTKAVRKCLEKVSVRVTTIHRSVEKIVEMNVSAQPAHLVDKQACQYFRQHFFNLTVEALTTAVVNSFNALLHRLQKQGTLGTTYPLLEVGVLLCMPSISVTPSLEDAQAGVDTVVDQVLTAVKQIPVWKELGMDTAATFHDQVIKDKQITGMMPVLQSRVLTCKESVDAYLQSFHPFASLWQSDLASVYAAFLAKNPQLEEFEEELKKYMAVEQDVAAIAPRHVTDGLALDAQPLKNSLRSEAASWKAQFARNLHKQGAQDLKAFEAYVKETMSKLGRKVEDLEDVRFVMSVLKEVREKDSDADNLIGPIEEMYVLLRRYEVRIASEEFAAVSDLRYLWKKLHDLASFISDHLSQLQIGFRAQLRREVAAFVMDARDFRADWVTNGPMIPNLTPAEAIVRLKLFQQMFEVRKRKWNSYRSGEELFGLPITKYEGLETTENELGLLTRLYGLYSDVITTISGYGDLLWQDVVEQIDSMNERVLTLQTSSKTLPKALREWPAYLECKRTIDEFLLVLPLFQQLAHKALRPRHWKEVMDITGKDFNLAADVFKLQHLLDANLLPKAEEIEEICTSAVKEEMIEVKLNSITARWSTAVFTFADYKTRGPVVLQPADTAEIVESLEDSQMTLASLAANRYAAPFREEVTSWLSKLASVSEQVESWLQVQSLWMYMEAVFSGGDIVKQLPAEAKRFGNIDKTFMKIVNTATETKSVVSTCVGSDMLKTVLPHLLEQLELCQKSLSAYLEAKRAEFPRFYFVSDPTLLEILSLGSDPPSIVPHFQSGLFDSLTNVTFDKGDKTKMTEMWSQQGEKVPFEKPVEAKGMVEQWVQRLVDGMQSTMKAIIKRAARNVNELSLEDFLFNNPAQVALLGLQFQWTADTQAALMASKTEKGVLVKALKKAETMLKDMVAMTLRSNLTRIQRISLETCITVHMHQKESTEDLVRKKVKDASDFEWLKQCRFYWREDKQTVIISICDVDFEYSFEYLGVKERLVITPLTDICYVTLSQALGMFLGGAPAGPAGTGKTETTKDLGNTLGKYVVVFNCSDQMDFKGMGKIYKGLAQSGLWGCFDEFNRINLDVLSVCAQQVHCILSAIRERKKSFVFTDGSSLSLDPRVGLFITMNPGYAGRVELPENLKALFRGVSMMVPNRQIIMKVKLAACGYQENEILAKKFYVLYGLCEQQLSKQAHYDFGLRNILSVLRTAGASKRAAPEQ